MRISVLAIDDPRWSEFIDSHQDATPFHLPAWAAMIAECYRFEAFVLAAHDAGGELIAGLPCAAVTSPLGGRRWVSLPFTDSCPVLTRPGMALSELVPALREFAFDNEVRELEVRGGLPAADGVHPVAVGYLHSLALPEDPADLHPNKGHRNSRNRARRSGIQITRGTSATDIDAFYHLHTLTRRRHGVPVQPRRFFDLIQSRLLSHGHGWVTTATLDGQVLASGVYLSHNGTLVAKYYASDPAVPNSGAGYLIEWESMVTGCLEGYHTYDMGRSDPDADGLRLYKSSWGATETPLTYTHISHKAPEASQLHVGALPKRIIRHSPAWVCRALGEVLYRWSA